MIIKLKLFFLIIETGARLFSIKSIDQSNNEDFMNIQSFSDELIKSSIVLTKDGYRPNNLVTMSYKTGSVSNIENNTSGDFAKLVQSFKKFRIPDRSIFDINTDDTKQDCEDKVDQISLNTTSVSGLNSEDDGSDDEKNNTEKVEKL